MVKDAEKQKKKKRQTKKEKIEVLICQERDRLIDIYKNIPEKKYQSALKLIDNMAFMSVTLESLMDEIKKSKLIVKTKNASQEFLKESPALASYNKMYTNFLKGIQQLNSLLPSDDSPPSNPNSDPSDTFEKFIYERNHRK